MAKAFSFSFSKMNNFDTCPKRHYEVDLAKNYTESSEQLTWGNQVHDAMAKATVENSPLPDSMKDWQKWVDEIATAPGTLLVEQKLAITKDFQPCPWFAPGAWYRGVVDVARIDGPVARARDYKTGKIKHDSRQLMLMATVLFAHHPRIKRIKTEFVWLKEDATTPEVWDRVTIMREWPAVLDMVKQMEDAARSMNYPPKPSRLCHSYCPVISCPFHGKRHA